MQGDELQKLSEQYIKFADLNDTDVSSAIDSTQAAMAAFNIDAENASNFLDTLNKENRILFLRRYWFGDSVQTIAKMRGMSENSVSVRLNRIRSKLRTYLIEEELL